VNIVKTHVGVKV